MQVAFASVAFAGVSAWTLDKAGRLIAGKPIGLLIAAAAGIQLRLLCSSLAGLLRTGTGPTRSMDDLYDEIADRIADVLVLVGAGYASRMMPWGLELGTAAAILAILTEHVRLLGGGSRRATIGPMTTRFRMVVMTLGCVAGAIEYIIHFTLYSVGITLLLIVIGSIITLVRRCSTDLRRSVL